MDVKKLKRILAIVALVFMAIFTVTFVIVLFSPEICGGAFKWISLVAVLLGVGLFLVIKFVLKDKEPPEYLPKPDDEQTESVEAPAENSDAEEAGEEKGDCENTDTENADTENADDAERSADEEKKSD